MCKRFLSLILASLAVCLASSPSTAQDLSFGEQDSTACKSLCAVPDAPWRSIPWEMDLLKAQRMAAEQSKPIFIWSMDGHPLGCT